MSGFFSKLFASCCGKNATENVVQRQAEPPQAPGEQRSSSVEQRHVGNTIDGARVTDGDTVPNVIIRAPSFHTGGGVRASAESLTEEGFVGRRVVLPSNLNSDLGASFSSIVGRPTNLTDTSLKSESKKLSLV